MSRRTRDEVITALKGALDEAQALLAGREKAHQQELELLERRLLTDRLSEQTDMSDRLAVAGDGLAKLLDTVNAFKSRHQQGGDVANALATLSAQVEAIRVGALPPEHPLLSTELPAFLKHKRDELDPQGEGNKYVDYTIGAAFRAWFAIIGDKPLNEYRPADLDRFGAVLMRVPANWTKFPRFRELSLKEAAEENERLKEPYETLTVTSIERGYLSPVKKGFNWICIQRSDIAPLRSPFADVKAQAPRHARPATERETLETEDVNAILRVAAKRSAAAERWLPLLAVVTGARLGELVYLQAADLVNVNGTWALDLRKDIRVNGQRRKRKTKSKSAKRLIALHRCLEDAGFIEWAQRRSGFLFERLHRAKRPTDAASKRVRRLMKAAGVSGSELVFHSTRHTAKQWFEDAGITERDVRLQVGHAMSGVHGRYGKKKLRQRDLKKFEEVSLPSDLDLSPYLKGRR
jgi:integrase